ncbi:MAG: alcohol dehydrogenase catalytic domain-containing protein [Proteobacteria bacterium]|nr:alcohol dehydrogenase catalytic domain-containing protein [Pseudomonadota bacterium]MBU4382781.1 alcohol dehydrogenase catalytic domain-containing protein [Pseudomonadota bacterium]MBU4605336.1 alcohol dehydrogenase catalytic domain-containing protein [Pseudomonadota bacterium]MCG2765296.1 alcohol dehydrogenase catalytic domain-containing protein [Desulfarculaceae bacterium]
MKAFVKHGKEPGQAAVQDVARPAPGPGEVLIKVAGCGICGSDLHAFNNDPGYEFVTPPVILGHEFSGVVVETGPGVDPEKVGDHVTAVAIQGCLKCPACLSGNSHLCPERQVIGLHFDGAMAGFVTCAADQLLSLPSNLDLSLAPLVEPVSVALHALRRTVIRPGDKVVVSGPGPIGLLCAGLAKLHGAKVLLLGMNRDAAVRLPAAQRLGLETAIVEGESPEELVRSTFGPGMADLFIEASGSTAALKTGFNLVHRGGTMIIVALYNGELTWFPSPAVRDELTILLSYASTRPDYAQAISLMADQAMDFSVLAQPFPLEKAEEAFQEALGGQLLKPVLVV